MLEGAHGELGRYLQRESSLPRPARPGDGHQARPVAEQLKQLVELALASEQRARRHRQVRRIERLQRRKVVRAELVEPRRRGQVLEPVLAQILDVHVDQVSVSSRTSST